MAGLALRLWLACLGGALIAGGGTLWVVGRIGPDTLVDPGPLVVWLSGSAALGILTAVGLALWFHVRLIGSLQGLSRSVASMHEENLRGLSASSGWGELSVLTRQLRALLAGHRDAVRAKDELEILEQRLAKLAKSVELWNSSERWEPLAIEGGPLADVAQGLDRSFERATLVREQNQEAVRLVRVELAAALADAQESVEQAERGFVEATALLTSVRELSRLTGEVERALAAGTAISGASPQVAEAYERQRAVTASAIEELVVASTESVEHLARGLARVQEIGDHVHLLGNRATLIALNAVVAPGAARSEEGAEELKALAREVRAATGSADSMSREIEREITAAAQRMKGIRERVAARLDQATTLPALEAGPLPEDLARLNDRVREMVQDATRKGERVSAAAERASRAAERFLRRLEEELREIEGLALRLGPLTTEQEGRAARPETPAQPRPLRLLDAESQGQEPETREENS